MWLLLGVGLVLPHVGVDFEFDMLTLGDSGREIWDKVLDVRGGNSKRKP